MEESHEVVSLRAVLREQGFHEPVTFASVPLVTHLLDELLVSRAETHDLAQRVESLTLGLATQSHYVEPLKLDNSRLIAENAMLHASLLETQLTDDIRLPPEGDCRQRERGRRERAALPDMEIGESGEGDADGDGDAEAEPTCQREVLLQRECERLRVCLIDLASDRLQAEALAAVDGDLLASAQLAAARRTAEERERLMVTGTQSHTMALPLDCVPDVSVSVGGTGASGCAGQEKGREVLPHPPLPEDEAQGTRGGMGGMEIDTLGQGGVEVTRGVGYEYAMDSDVYGMSGDGPGDREGERPTSQERERARQALSDWERTLQILTDGESGTEQPQAGVGVDGDGDVDGDGEDDALCSPSTKIPVPQPHPSVSLSAPHSPSPSDLGARVVSPSMPMSASRTPDVASPSVPVSVSVSVSPPLPATHSRVDTHPETETVGSGREGGDGISRTTPQVPPPTVPVSPDVGPSLTCMQSLQSHIQTQTQTQTQGVCLTGVDASHIRVVVEQGTGTGTGSDGEGAEGMPGLSTPPADWGYQSVPLPVASVSYVTGVPGPQGEREGASDVTGMSHDGTDMSHTSTWQPQAGEEQGGPGVVTVTRHTLYSPASESVGGVSEVHTGTVGGCQDDTVDRVPCERVETVETGTEPFGEWVDPAVIVLEGRLDQMQVSLAELSVELRQAQREAHNARGREREARESAEMRDASMLERCRQQYAQILEKEEETESLKVALALCRSQVAAESASAAQRDTRVQELQDVTSKQSEALRELANRVKTLKRRERELVRVAAVGVRLASMADPGLSPQAPTTAAE
ncbi:hypothetical protein KIPB_003809 [Kipferlia bialata]|uniref:Uncharacterized protein n=1 Tax=Kipferlia bialata TaxID=797122 RepID=A0A9K3CUG8_9EUKA|nr:hypothetical protein KIPB_003809 [Kipferlia bialata]|eukprot:g3809.t1